MGFALKFTFDLKIRILTLNSLFLPIKRAKPIGGTVQMMVGKSWLLKVGW